MMSKKTRKTIDHDYQTHYVAKDSVGTVVFFTFIGDRMEVIYYDTQGIGFFNTKVEFKLNDLNPKKREFVIVLGQILMNAMLIQEEIFSILIRQENNKLFQYEEPFCLN